MLDYWRRKLTLIKIKGFLKDPCFCLGIIAVFLFNFVFLIAKSDFYLTFEESGKDNLFISSAKRFLPESPEFLLIENSFLKASSPPTVFSSQILGALIGGYEQEENARKTITEYIVETGDTLSSLTDKFNISLETILWANDLTKSSTIKEGQKLVILPVSGIVHYVNSGDAISKIAKIYKGSAEEIVAFNRLSNENDIYVGDIIIVPNGLMPLPAAQQQQSSADVPLTASQFIVPVSSPYIITQGLHWYNAVDFSHKGNACGKPVFAAAGGSIQKIGYDSIAGNFVRILHSREVITFYGHLSIITVSKNDVVKVGDIIGYIGNTGYTLGQTGCHLHFEVRNAKNPFI